MFRIVKLILGVCLLTEMQNLWAFESIIIKESTPMSSQPLFGRERYHQVTLNPGLEAEIISVSTQHQGGVALQVRTSNGQVGWVYLSSDESKRTLSVLDQEKREVSLPHVRTHLKAFEDDQVLSNLGTNKKVDNPANEFKSAFSPAIQRMERLEIGGVYSKEPELVSVKSDKEIWESFKDGKMELQEDSYEDGIFTFTDKESGQKFSAAFQSEYLGDLPEKVQSLVQNDIDCEEEAPKRFGALSQARFLPGCEVLASGISDASKSKLSQCLNSIKSTLSGGKKLTPADRAKVFPMFYSKLNPLEQEFMAHIVTSIGEAGVLAPPVEEMVAIMMILENRKSYAREKGFHSANVLDAALQPLQFSMYNKGAHHWSDALNRSNSDEQTQYALDAFVKLKQTRFTSAQKEVYHYHTEKVSPPWKTPNKLLKMVINGVELKSKGKRHLYYRDIGWSFKNNPWSKK